MRRVVLLSVLFLAGCAHTPTAEESRAQYTQWEEACRSRGYKLNTPDFQHCVSQYVAQGNAANTTNAVATAGAGIWAATLLMNGLAVLSDVRVKRDVEKLGDLRDGIGLYRFRYLWSDETYVGVIAQEVERTVPQAVVRGADGYLRVNYALLGTRFMTWNEWAR